MEDTLLAADAAAASAARAGDAVNVATEETAILIGKLLQEHKAGEVVVLDLRELSSWTDFFVIAGATSNTHLQALERHVKEFAQERGIEILRKSQRPHLPQSDSLSADEWRLIDMGTAVVHLLTDNARSFYELERLWGSAKIVPLG
jgi:ribosome-associated protein